MYKRTVIFFLCFIILFGLFLRVYKIDSIPPHPSLDEATIGYNAYSILHTGKDEFGNRTPILLRAYDDYRPALYVYLVIPFVWMLDLTVAAVRMPSVILSTVSLLFFYIASRRIFKEVGVSKPEALSLMPVFLLAISPWHIYISRLGHEVNAFQSFFIIGLGLFLNSIKKQQVSMVQLVLSSIFLALSFDAYQSGKIFIPLFLMLLFVCYFKLIKKNWKKFLVASAVGAMVILPIILVSFQPEAMLRFKATNVFNVPFEIGYQNAQKLIEFKKNSDYINIILFNRNVVPIVIFVQSFFSHFTFDFLYKSAENGQFRIPGFGLVYLMELPLLIGGITFFVLKRKWKWLTFLFAWYVIGILPSALTTGAPQPMRSFAAIGVLPLLAGTSLGLVKQYKNKNKAFIVGLASFVCLIFTISISQFYLSYFNVFPQKYSSQFQYGVIQSFEYLDSLKNKQKKIIISNRGYLTASYMFYLFYKKYDPVTYQKNGGSVSGWLNYDHLINNISFSNTQEVKVDGILMVIDPTEYKKGNILKEIKNLNGDRVIEVVER